MCDNQPFSAQLFRLSRYVEIKRPFVPGFGGVFGTGGLQGVAGVTRHGPERLRGCARYASALSVESPARGALSLGGMKKGGKPPPGYFPIVSGKTRKGLRPLPGVDVKSPEQGS